uniref:Uncharacterized protein n=1 Tax=Biomphalaria glabrata TaxID=6526 RepID=A0A2C9KPE2_BIOGL
MIVSHGMVNSTNCSSEMASATQCTCGNKDKTAKPNVNKVTSRWQGLRCRLHSLLPSFRQQSSSQVLKDKDKMDIPRGGACSAPEADGSVCLVHSNVNINPVTSDVTDSVLSALLQPECDNLSLLQPECDTSSLHHTDSSHSSLQQSTSDSGTLPAQLPEPTGVHLADSVRSSAQESPRSSLQRQQRIWTALNIAEMNNNSQTSLSLNDPQDEADAVHDASDEAPTEGNAVFLFDELIDHDYSTAQEDALFGGVLRCILDNMTVGQLYANLHKISLEDKQPLDEGDDDVFENVWSDDETSLSAPCT